MTQKRTYKVLALIPKHDGSGSWFMKVGSAYTNRDDSINLYVDAIPVGGNGKGITLQLRELDPAELAQREAFRSRAATSRTPEPPAPAGGSSANESVPF